MDPLFDGPIMPITRPPRRRYIIFQFFGTRDAHAANVRYARVADPPRYSSAANNISLRLQIRLEKLIVKYRYIFLSLLEHASAIVFNVHGIECVVIAETLPILTWYTLDVTVTFSFDFLLSIYSVILHKFSIDEIDLTLLLLEQVTQTKPVLIVHDHWSYRIDFNPPLPCEIFTRSGNM